MSHLPNFYDPSQVGRVYTPNTALAIQEGQRAGWSPAARDSKKIALVIVDAQVDFVHKDGALSVPGAIEDTQRLIGLIYREGHRISTIVPTIDTHYPFMIFFGTWWRGRDGKSPEPFTIITENDIQEGIWRAVIDPNWSHRYPGKLAKKGKKQLMIWPYHCMDTTPGINLVPPLSEAIMFHGAARHAQPVIVHKGHIPLTEFYSPWAVEVEVTGVPGGTMNKPILDQLAKHDEIWIAGQAKSHCVLEGVRTLVEYLGSDQPEVLERVLFLMDCTSSVVHPAVDFDAIANAELQQMQKNHGIQLIKSTDLYT